VKKYLVKMFMGEDEVVLADNFYVDGSLVLFEEVTEEFETTLVLALQQADISRIAYLGEHTE